MSARETLASPRTCWPRIRFGDVVRNVLDTERDPLSAGLERYVGVADLQPQDLHIRTWGDVADGTTFTRRFRAGQVLFSKRRAYQRKVAVAEFDGVCSGDLLVFEPKGDQLLPNLLPFIVQSEGFYERAIRTSAGSLSPRTRWSDLAAYEFPLPPPDEQRRIAEVLWAVEKATERWRQAIAALDQLKLSVSRQLFQEDHDVPIVRLDQVCEYLTVGIVVKPAELYVAEGVSTLRSLNVLPDRFALDDLVFISEDAHAEHKKSQLRSGDVVIVRSGRPGDAAVIPPQLDNINCIDLVIARPGPVVRPGYVSRYINSQEGRRQLTGLAAGTAQKHVNVSAASQLMIPLLPLHQQDEVVSRLVSIDNQLQDLRSHLVTTAEVKTALLNRLLDHGE